MLKLAFEKNMLKGKSIGIDSTTLEANAAICAALAHIQAIWAMILAILIEIDARIRELMPDLVGASIVPHPDGCRSEMAVSSTGC